MTRSNSYFFFYFLRFCRFTKKNDFLRFKGTSGEKTRADSCVAFIEKYLILNEIWPKEVSYDSQEIKWWKLSEWSVTFQV